MPTFVGSKSEIRKDYPFIVEGAGQEVGKQNTRSVYQDRILKSEIPFN